MDILSNDAYEPIVSWLPSGQGFLIHKKKAFATEVLPKHFKAAKFTSFTRKLNRWGFNRAPRGPETGAYFHKLFLRDKPELCLQMTSNSGNKYQTNTTQQHLLPHGASGMHQQGGGGGPPPMHPYFMHPHGMMMMQPQPPPPSYPGAAVMSMTPQQQQQAAYYQMQQMMQWQQMQAQQQMHAMYAQQQQQGGGYNAGAGGMPPVMHQMQPAAVGAGGMMQMMTPMASPVHHQQQHHHPAYHTGKGPGTTPDSQRQQRHRNSADPSSLDGVDDEDHRNDGGGRNEGDAEV
jgi:HSF-type DNA-binding